MKELRKHKKGKQLRKHKKGKIIEETQPYRKKLKFRKKSEKLLKEN